MNRVNIQNLFEQAIKEIEIAEQELHRPDEDVVTLAVCGKTKHSIRKLLTYYLLRDFEKNSPAKNIDRKLNQLNNFRIIQLYDLCAENNAAFAGLDVSSLKCCKMSPDSKYEGYCLSIEMVKSCFSLLKEIQSIVTTVYA